MNILRLLISLLFLCTLTSCAQKPWNASLDPDQTDALRTQILTLQQQKQQCPTSITCDITATWNAPLQNGGMTGYLQVYSPAYIKLVALTPLSQPLFALTLDGKKFQALDVSKGWYHFGRAEHFARLHDIPSSFLDGNWAEWFTARASFTKDQILDIRKDTENRGLWLTIGYKKSGKIREYLLYDLQKNRILERIPCTSKGKEVATINYDSWTDSSPCALPQLITITKSHFATDITIKLSDIQPGKDFDKKTFYLRIPPSYMRKYYP